MTQVARPQIETLLLDPVRRGSALEDAASMDANLKEAATAAEELFSRVMRTGENLEDEETIREEVSEGEARKLFQSHISQKGIEGTVQVIQGNLKNLAGAAESRIYSGFFGTILQLFHYFGLYNPSEVEQLKSLASRDFVHFQYMNLSH